MPLLGIEDIFASKLDMATMAYYYAHSNNQNDQHDSLPWLAKTQIIWPFFGMLIIKCSRVIWSCVFENGTMDLHSSLSIELQISKWNEKKNKKLKARFKSDYKHKNGKIIYQNTFLFRIKTKRKRKIKIMDYPFI